MGLYCPGHIGADSNRREAVVTPDNSVFHRQFEFSDLIQGDTLLVRQLNRQ